MKKKNISHELQYQVRDYLEYFWNESKYQDIEAEKKIINQLSNNLKESLMIEANRAFILQSPIFNDNFTLKTILKIIPLIKEQKYNPEEVIYFQDEIEDTSLYFIEKGQVEIFQASQNIYQQSQSFIALKTGSFFGNLLYFQSKFQQVDLLFYKKIGENEFFTGQPRKQSFRSIEFTTLLKIEREKFLQIIKEDNGDYERYCLIRDSILNKYNIKSITRKCQLCEGVLNQNPNHLEYNCPIVHFIPNFTKIQARFSYNQSQSVRQYFKRKQHQYETLKNSFQSNQNKICFYSRNLKQINDYVSNYCQKFNLLSELEQNQQGDQIQIYSNLKDNNAGEYTQTYLNTNISYSSEDSSDESNSSEIKSSYKKSSLSSSNNSFTLRAKPKKRTQLHPDIQIIKEEDLQGYSNQIKNQVQPSAFSRQIQLKKQKNFSQSSVSKSDSSSLDQQESSQDNSQSIKDAIISQNEFFTMKDVLQDPRIPSIQHLSLEEQNKNKIQRSQVNQIQNFKTNSLKLVQQKNNSSLQNTNFSHSSNNQNLTYKKLSSDMSSQDFLNTKELLKNRMNQKFTTDQEILPKKVEQDQKQAEFIIQEQFELENSLRKRSHSLSAQNNIIEDINCNDTNQNLIEQAKMMPNQQRIKNNQKNHLNALRRGSHQIQKQSSYRQINHNNYQENSQQKISINSSNKIYQNTGFSQKNTSQNNLSNQNQNLLLDIKKIIETQIDQVSQNIKSIRECFEKKEKEEQNSEQSLKIDINNIEFTNLEDLDRMKLYEIYFVHNNYDKVIFQQSQLQKRTAKKKDLHQENMKNNSNAVKISSQFRHSTIFKQRIQQSLNIRNSQLLFASNLNYSNLSKLQNLRNDFSKKTINLEKNKSIENFSDQQLTKNKLQNILDIKQNKTNSPTNYQDSLSSNLVKKINVQNQMEKEESKKSPKNKQIVQNESTFSAKVDLVISESLCLQNYQQKQTKQSQINRSQFYSPQVRAEKFYEKSVQSIEYLE